MQRAAMSMGKLKLSKLTTSGRDGPCVGSVGGSTDKVKDPNDYTVSIRLSVQKMRLWRCTGPTRNRC